jgi:uncharacterized protein involved in exopolysaccharide biosynthesis
VAGERHSVGAGGQPPLAVIAYEGTTATAGIGLIDIWRILGRHKFMIAACALAAAALATAAALLMTPVYRAEVLVAPVDDPDDSQRTASSLGEYGGLAALAGLNLGHEDKRTESIATLRSRQFAEQFIAERQLERILFADLWDEANERWEADAGDDVPSAWDVYERFDERVRKVHEDRGTGLVRLVVEWHDAALAAQWANELVASVNATLRRKTVEESEKSIAYLREQLARTSVVDLQQVLHRLVESEMKTAILANINKEYAFKIIDPAVAPEKPVRPRKLAMIVAGAAAGGMLGVLLVLLRNAGRSPRGGQPDGSGAG